MDKRPELRPVLRPVRLRGASQNNLKNLDLSLIPGTLTVVCGVSGAGKSSLVFDTLYAEGQRRYVETFSAYARQFLERIERPKVDSLDDVPPAIAILASNSIRNSRSTVGTMTELNDYVRLLFARAAQLFDQDTGLPVQQDSTDSIVAAVNAQLATLAQTCPQHTSWRVTLSFAAHMPHDSSAEDITQWLAAAGYTRVLNASTAREVVLEIDGVPHTYKVLDVEVDRLRYRSAADATLEHPLWLQAEQQARLREAVETALQRGEGQVRVDVQSSPSDSQGEAGTSPESEPVQRTWRWSTALHCPESGRSYAAPEPHLFSFNSALAACKTCKGFGRVIGVDWGLVIPDARKTLAAGAIKVFQTPAWQECQDDLRRHAALHAIPVDTPWQDLSAAQQHWVLHGEPGYRDGQWSKKWYGVQRFFDYLESKAYKMHIRVLLSRYRSYTTCEACAGARLQTPGLLWRLGSKDDADAVLPAQQRFMPQACGFSRSVLESLPGLCVHDVMQLPLNQLLQFLQRLQNTAHAGHNLPLQQALNDTVQRVQYLCDVGLNYLTLDRQSRSLSGGEVQRINLTTALGSHLVHTLFVLDEPSIGLHARDVTRLMHAMQSLKEAGNTLVVVEHDPAMILAADRVLELGPAAGEAGGQIVFDGTPVQLLQANTATARALRAPPAINPLNAKPLHKPAPQLLLRAVRRHNLRIDEISIPLRQLVVVTGVSGSGKSTLVQDVLAPLLQRHFGHKLESETGLGAPAELLGADHLSGVVLVDQAPIGKSARSTPASYTQVMEVLRARFAATALAQERGYRSSHFSFNSGDGRCPQCGGAGHEHIEMQFLSDVYLRCQACDGKRYAPEILEVQWTVGGRSYTIDQVLQLTVREAQQAFAGDAPLLRALQPLADVGLAYLRLGQSVPTLSGGEAQRLKLAAWLGETLQNKVKTKVHAIGAATKGRLLIFDEPTTGLHSQDSAHLMQVFAQLIQQGHSVLVVEHNVEVIAQADWLLDLGPEGGLQGGQVLAVGTPAQVMACAQSHTGAALRAYAQGYQARFSETQMPVLQVADPGVVSLNWSRAQQDAIRIVQARENNLKNVSLNIPHGRLNVMTGVSGSGKSTLAFDIVFGEGQRRYLDSLGAYARALVQGPARAQVEAVYGLAPTVAIEQRTSRGGNRSTVGTITEVWHYLRLLFVRLGVQHCIHDGAPVQAQSPEQLLLSVCQRFAGQHIGILAPLVRGRKGHYAELADWAASHGYSHLRVDGVFVPTEPFQKLDRYREHRIELPIADLRLSQVVSHAERQHLQSVVLKALELGKGVLEIMPLQGQATTGLAEADLNATPVVYSTVHSCPECHTSYEAPDPRLFSYNSKHGWCPDCVGTGLKLDTQERKALDDSQVLQNGEGREQSFEAVDGAVLAEAAHGVCPSCQGARLNATARAVRVQGWNISTLAAWDIPRVLQWCQTWQVQLGAHEGANALDARTLDARTRGVLERVLPEIVARLTFLCDVGLGYLQLDRAAPSLSGGEAQRIRLAAQLGSNLQGVCYVLDEPTIGLHARDNAQLLKTLRALTDKGNTLLVVEHDPATIRAADHIIDIGPGAGRMGGTVVAQGDVASICANPLSLTGQCLQQQGRHQWASDAAFNKATETEASAPIKAGLLTVRAATLHNLQHVDCALPLQNLVVFTGVSGSGKSSLARGVLLANVQAALAAGTTPTWQHCQALEGWQGLGRVQEVDQTPIGKTPRSCAATYIGFWDDVRKLYASTLEAKERGYSASRFSFNTGPGRCPVCEGQGMRTVGMHFLQDAQVLCESCHGARFNRATLQIRWRGQHLGDVLNMDVQTALDFFAGIAHIAAPLQLLLDVGLGYLRLGQASPTLSGGEAQRIKLVAELARVQQSHISALRRGQKVPHTLYVLDEPTTGLHMADVARLITVLKRFVASGHSVIAIEHDLDFIAAADHIIDLGPEGGAGGGRIVAQGSVQDLLQSGSATGLALQAMLQG